MEGEEGPLRQELFENLADFSAPFGEPASADTVSTFLALPEGRNYDAQLPLGLWRDSGSAGALECIRLPLENRADDRPPRRCRPPSPPRNGKARFWTGSRPRRRSTARRQVAPDPRGQ